MLDGAALLQFQIDLGHYLVVEFAQIAAFSALVIGIFGTAAGMLIGLRPFTRIPLRIRRLIYAAAFAGSLCILYGIIIEPYRLTVRRIEIESDKIQGKPVRIVHLSDLHVRRWSRLEEKLVAKVRLLKPDLILLTGDYTAVPPSVIDTNRLMRELGVIASTYAIRGNSELRGPPFRSLTAGGKVTWLLNRSVDLTVAGTPLTLTGVDAGNEAELVRLARAADRSRLTICLYHFPDFAPQIGAFPFDLMLSGHTHGGQIRLPLIGALVSASRAGTAYARGLFQQRGRAIYVNQGIGTESYKLPPMRFLAPPEVALIEIRAPAA